MSVVVRTTNIITIITAIDFSVPETKHIASSQT